jgi:diguanylate cyclase (GGDEF)-like protein
VADAIRHPRTRTVFVVAFLLPLLVATALGGQVVRDHWLRRQVSVALAGDARTLSTLAELRAAVSDEEARSTTIVVAREFNLAEIGWFDADAAQRALVASREAVDELMDQPLVSALLDGAALDVARRGVDEGRLDYGQATGAYDLVVAGVVAEWRRLDAALELAAEGGRQAPEVQARLRALRATADAFSSAMPRGRHAVEIYLGTGGVAGGLELLELNARFHAAATAAQAALGPEGAVAWRRFLGSEGVQRVEAYFEDAPLVGFGVESFTSDVSPEVWRQSIIDGGTWARLAGDLVRATAADVVTVADARAREDEAAVAVATGLATAVLIGSAVLVRMTTRRLTQPVRDLESAARRVEQGIFSDEPVPPRGPRELAAALQAFNEMAATLAALERHAVALADDLDDPALDVPLPGRTGEAMQAALDRLRGSIEDAELQRALLQQLATRDPLTGLLNRRAAFDAMDRDVARVARGGAGLVALFVDLDGLKGVNDTHGHAVGDAAICAAARVLVGAARASDVVARLGGDEFLVVGTVATGEAGELEARALADRLLCAFDAAAVSTDRGREVRLRASIGGALSGAGPIAADELVRRADGALYEAKRSGRGRVAWAGSAPPAAPLGEPVERGGIGERTPAGGDVDGGAGEDALDRDLELLAAEGAGHGGDRLDAVR